MGAVASQTGSSATKGNGSASGVAGRQPTGTKPGEAASRPVLPVADEGKASSGRPMVRAPLGKRPAPRKSSSDKPQASRQSGDKSSSGKKDSGSQSSRTATDKRR
jgi:hypothetical protein